MFAHPKMGIKREAIPVPIKIIYGLFYEPKEFLINYIYCSHTVRSGPDPGRPGTKGDISTLPLQELKYFCKKNHTRYNYHSV